MTSTRTASAWPNALVLLLCLLAPTLGLLAWVLGSSEYRPLYLRSFWVRAGLVVLVVGSAPLLTIGIAAEVGLWPDPNPNPIGFGLLFVFAAIVSTVLLAIGAIRVWLSHR